MGRAQAYQPGLASPDRCRTSFHHTHIDASTEAPIRWRTCRRNLVCERRKQNALGGKPPEGVRGTREVGLAPTSLMHKSGRYAQKFAVRRITDERERTAVIAAVRKIAH